MILGSTWTIGLPSADAASIHGHFLIFRTGELAVARCHQGRQVRVQGGAVAPGGHPRGQHFCPCIIFSAFNFLVCCCFTDLTCRHILLLCSSFCFQLVLGLTLHPRSEHSNCMDIGPGSSWNPCSPYTVVNLVLPALFIFINILFIYFYFYYLFYLFYFIYFIYIYFYYLFLFILSIFYFILINILATGATVIG